MCAAQGAARGRQACSLAPPTRRHAVCACSFVPPCSKASLHPQRLQVAKSVEYVQAGTTHLVAAKRLQKNTRKWMCCALILLIIIACAIAIPIALKLTK